MAYGVSSSDSITINLGNSAISFSKLDSKRIRFSCSLYLPYVLLFIRWS